MPERGGRFLPAEGADCPESSYWRKRLREGSVVRSTKSSPAKSTRATDRG